MSEPPTIYLDACVLLSWINGEADRLADVDAVLDEGRKGKSLLVTSVLSIVEVAAGKAEQDGKELDDDTLSKIESLWLPPSPIRLLEFFELIAREARDLMRAAIPGSRRLKPADAIHLASARHWDARYFYTYDDLSAFGPLTGLSIQAPSPIEPQLPWAIPAALPTEPPPPSEPPPGARLD